MISKDELLEMLNDNESARIEKTISKTDTDKFGQAICAFANDLPNYQKCGYLIIGAEDKKGISPEFKVTDQLLQNLAAIKDNGNIVPPPALSVEKFVFDQGELAVVEVFPHYQPPVRYKQQVWIRNGPRKSVANEGEERLLSEKRSSFARAFETRPCYESQLTDLSLDIFKLSYLPTAIDSEALERNHRDTGEQLASLKFFDLIAIKPTNVGIIMFGKNPRFFVPGDYIQYVRFNGKEMTDEVVFSKEFSGDLFSILKNLDDFIKYQIITEKLEQVSILREKNVLNYPHWALRELMLNAIIHRDYESSAPIKFYEFSDRIEIHNPGGLHGNARPENFPNMNDYRNPELASIVKNLGYINKFNYGVKRAIKLLKENGNPDPEFKKNELHFFCVIIFAA